MVFEYSTYPLPKSDMQIAFEWGQELLLLRQDNARLEAKIEKLERRLAKYEQPAKEGE